MAPTLAELAKENELGKSDFFFLLSVWQICSGGKKNASNNLTIILCRFVDFIILSLITRSINTWEWVRLNFALPNTRF